MKKLNQNFYARDTLTVARELLGKHLMRVVDGVPLTLRITETEAYIGRMDKACHAYNYKRTKRTETLFASPGTAYLYLIYGMYTCLNCVTEAEGEPAAVLIRGGEPADAQSADLLSNSRFGWQICPLINEKTFSMDRENCVRLFPLPQRRMGFL